MKEKMHEEFIVFLIKRAERRFNHFKSEQLIIGGYDIVQYFMLELTDFFSTVAVNGKE